ncbi:uncharacterized protein LOC143919131 isoform X2 [Arctopsyche grandis]
MEMAAEGSRRRSFRLRSLRPLKPQFEALADISLSPPHVMLGRALSNHTVIPHVGISRQHCTFTVSPDGSWILKDMSSAGIVLNNKRVPKNESLQLNDGDVLRLDALGEFSYAFERVGDVSNDEDTTCVGLDYDSDNGIQRMKAKFENSQSFEIDRMQKKISSAKEKHEAIVNEKILLQKRHRESLNNVENNYRLQIQNLKGDLNQVQLGKEKLLAQAKLEKEEHEQSLKIIVESLEKKINEYKFDQQALIEDNKSLIERLNNEKEAFEKRLDEVINLKQKKVDTLEKQLNEKDLRLLHEKESMEKKMLEDAEHFQNKMNLIIKDWETRTILDQKEIKVLQSQIQIHETNLSKSSVTELENQKSMDEMKSKLEKLQQERSKEVIYLSEYAAKCAALEVAKKDAEKKLAIIETEAEKKDKSSRKRSSSDMENNEGPSSSAKDILLKEYSELMETEMICSICSEFFIKSTTLNCGHSFCHYCIKSWKKQKPQCPICRAKITSEQPNIIINSVIDKIIVKLDEDAKKHRSSIIQQRLKPVRVPKKSKKVCTLEDTSFGATEFYGYLGNTSEEEAAASRHYLRRRAHSRVSRRR